MADKLQAKEIAKKVNIPTLDTVEKVSLAKKIGFPLVIIGLLGQFQLLLVARIRFQVWGLGLK